MIFPELGMKYYWFEHNKLCPHCYALYRATNGNITWWSGEKYTYYSLNCSIQ